MEELIEKAQNGDENAIEKLLSSYKPLVNKIARSYFLTGGDIEDLVQEGMIGLYKAIKTFKKEKTASYIYCKNSLFAKSSFGEKFCICSFK